jgi:hypothetical protein
VGGATPYYREWGAWYGGNPADLTAVYGGPAGPAPIGRRFFGSDMGAVNHPAQYRGGVQGWIARKWWGQPITAGQNTTKLHIPAAADIAMISADLLFTQLPAFTSDDKTAQERLEGILDLGGVHSRLLEAAEVCSAYGGAYVRVCVDTSISDVPLFEAIPPDAAIPEWRYGILTAVTFWREVDGDAGAVLRHLERHEVTPGVGAVIYHALYRGTSDRLGVPMPLDYGDEECQRLALLVNEAGAIPAGATGRPVEHLDVAYVPNMRPHRLIRGSNLGRSDFSGAEGPMDALDEAWSSLIRDIRLAKGRLVIPSAYLQSGGRGAGASFDMEQEVFQTVDALTDPTQGMSITVAQFAIRTTEHLDAAAAAWRVIMRTAGLSADAFGEDPGGSAITAKEAGQRGERTESTRLRKIAYWRDALRRLARVALELDAAHYKGAVAIEPIDVEWADEAAPDPESLAKTVQLLDAAKAVSTKTKVVMVHPDWDDAAVLEEVDLIDGPAVEDPTAFDGSVPPAGPASKRPLDIGEPDPAPVPAYAG